MVVDSNPHTEETAFHGPFLWIKLQVALLETPKWKLDTAACAVNWQKVRSSTEETSNDKHQNVLGGVGPTYSKWFV